MDLIEILVFFKYKNELYTQFIKSIFFSWLNVEISKDNLNFISSASSRIGTFTSLRTGGGEEQL